MMSDQQTHPCALFELDESDKEYNLQDDRGRSPRYLVEQLDGDRFCFPSREDAEEFMGIHGMHPVSSEEMDRLRKEMEGSDAE